MDRGQEEPAPAEADGHAVSWMRAMMIRLKSFCAVAAAEHDRVHHFLLKVAQKKET